VSPTKLKIDISTGTLEIEGEEAFVRNIYDDFKDRLACLSSIERAQTPRSAGKDADNPRPPSKASKSTSKPRGSGAKGKVSYSFVKDLDLSSKNGSVALKPFFTEKAPGTAMEKNAVFVYYLERLSKTTGITANHVYTCYKHVGVPVPGALRQSLLDTAHLKGWIDTKSMDDIRLSIHGENYVEHELPKKGKDAVTK
jgi:hypothetical protein